MLSAVGDPSNTLPLKGVETGAGDGGGEGAALPPPPQAAMRSVSSVIGMSAIGPDKNVQGSCRDHSLRAFMVQQHCDFGCLCCELNVKKSCKPDPKTVDAEIRVYRRYRLPEAGA